MATVASTVPGAVTTLQGYMQTVADNNPLLDIGVYLGSPVGSVKNNFMMVGRPEDGALFEENAYDWAAIPGDSMLISEQYALSGTIRAWDGSSEPLDRLTDAFTMLNSLQQLIRADKQGSGNLSPSGAWGRLSVTMGANGPLNAAGWGVVLGFTLDVVTAQLTVTA